MRRAQHDGVTAPIRIGTSGWEYDDWRGRFYPTDLSRDDQLRFYAERFDTVEVNATFYRMPTDKVVAGWAAAVPVRRGRGKSGLHRAGCWLTARRGDPTESATETYRRTGMMNDER